METKLFFDCRDCINLIKKTYPYIPKWVIKRVLYVEELYMHKIKIIKWKPDFKSWKNN